MAADPIVGYARVLLEVVAGLLPGTPMPEYSKRWAITGEQWRARGTGDDVVAQVEADCSAYAHDLRHGGLNWVQTTWLYL